MPIVSGGGGSGTVGQEVAYAEATATVSPVATTEGTANTVITATAFTADGVSAYLIECWADDHRPDNAVANRAMFFYLYQDGASIGELGSTQTVGAASDLKPLYLARRMVPAAGSRTYSVRAAVTAGTGAIGAGAGGLGNVMPIAIRVSKVT